MQRKLLALNLHELLYNLRVIGDDVAGGVV